MTPSTESVEQCNCASYCLSYHSYTVTLLSRIVLPITGIRPTREAICMTPSFDTGTLYYQVIKTTVQGWVHVSREFRAVDRNIVSLVGIVP